MNPSGADFKNSITWLYHLVFLANLNETTGALHVTRRQACLESLPLQDDISQSPIKAARPWSHRKSFRRPCYHPILGHVSLPITVSVSLSFMITTHFKKGIGLCASREMSLKSPKFPGQGLFEMS